MATKQHTKILFEYKDFEENYALESAWAEKKGNNYQLDNILFYASEYSLGDILSVENRANELYVTGLIEESGHSTIRIIFNREEDVANTRTELQAFGCDSEISNLPFLIAVDIPPNVQYARIRDFLEEGVKEKKWGYEEACIAHNS